MLYISGRKDTNILQIDNLQDKFISPDYSGAIFP